MGIPDLLQRLDPNLPFSLSKQVGNELYCRGEPADTQHERHLLAFRSRKKVASLAMAYPTLRSSVVRSNSARSYNRPGSPSIFLLGANSLK